MGRRKYTDHCTKEYFAAKQREYRARNREKSRESCRAYYEENKEEVIQKLVERRRTRLQTDPLYAFKQKVYRQFRKCLKNESDEIQVIVGCDYKTLMSHLRKGFGKRYRYVGPTNLEIDHIIPLELADSEDRVMELWNYKNLQYLRPVDNRSKGPRLMEVAG